MSKKQINFLSNKLHKYCKILFTLYKICQKIELNLEQDGKQPAPAIPKLELFTVVKYTNMTENE